MLMSLVMFFLCSGFTICLFTLNPTFLIIWLIVLSILLSGMFFMILNSWMSYAVILLFTGGMMVLFSYMLSLITSSKISFFYSPKIILMFWVTMTIFFTSSNTYKSMFMTSLFFQTSNMLLMILALYLLMVLLSMVNMASSNSGPMKSFFTYDQ